MCFSNKLTARSPKSLRIPNTKENESGTVEGGVLHFNHIAHNQLRKENPN